MTKKKKGLKEQPVPKKEGFLEKTWVAVLILFIFVPAGIYLLWKHQKFDPFVRIIISLLFGFAFIYYNYTNWVLPSFNEPKPSGPDTVQTGQGNNNSPNNSQEISSTENDQDADKEQPPVQDDEPYVAPVLPTVDFSSNRLLRVHFLDVAQGDSILIQTPAGKAILVDGGNSQEVNLLSNYLKNQGIEELEAVIATHPHVDHIGGLKAVLSQFPVSFIYLPEVTMTTQEFEDFSSAVEKNGAERLTARVGRSIPTEEMGLSMVFLAPNSNRYQKINNYSAVLKVTYNDISFLLTGDAETASEEEMLLYNRNVSADVLKVGSHGSRNASSQEFLEAVKPQYAVISLGSDNEYKYPHAEACDRLRHSGASILRTDKLGTLIIKTDGAKLSINSK